MALGRRVTVPVVRPGASKALSRYSLAQAYDRHAFMIAVGATLVGTLTLLSSLLTG